MKFSTYLSLAAISAATVCSSVFADSLKEQFKNPPESSRLQTWFHWNGDCVTKEGLVADIKAMAEMDIGTAHVFLPSMAHLPKTAKPLTPEWFELWQTAVREARKHNIKLGFHNCPGWSSSGGPWITPENSMKMLVAGETDFDPATGAKEIKLAQPMTVRNFYRDVSVVAFPMKRAPKLVNVTGDFPGNFDAFRDGKGAITLPLGKPDAKCEFMLEYDRPVDCSSAVFSLDDTNFYADGAISASADGKNWKQCAKLFYEMFNAQRTPKVISISGEARGARFFKVRLNGRKCPPWVPMRDRVLKSFVFAEQARVADVDSKNSASTSFGYRAVKSPETKGIDPGSMVNLTKHMRADGSLDVTALSSKQIAGDRIWRILRLGYTSTGKGCAPATLCGLECDKLSKKGLDAHWPHMPQRLIDFPEAKGVVSISIIDSYEVGGQNWTELMPQEFRSRRGYDVMPWLPAIAGYVVGTAGETAKFLFDYQRTVGDLFAENYYDYFTELCHKAGIESAVEPYGGPFDSMRCGAASDVPTGEFWLGRNAHGSPRIAASIGHLNGRSRIAAEAFTTEAKEGRWQITPAELRRCGDAGWLDGVSQLVYHSYLHQPFSNAKPGISLGRHGTQLNRFTTWWPEGIHWSRYVRRGQFLLQSGKPRAEVLIFTGASRPNNFQYANDVVAAGANFDYCGVSDLMRLEVVNGKVKSAGAAEYDVLYLGSDRYMTIEVLKKLQKLLKAGAKVAGWGPLGSPSLSDDEGEWKRLMEEVWKGIRQPANGKDALGALQSFGVRMPLESGDRLRATRREIDGRDVYFVVNPNEEQFSGTVAFVAKGVPELWEARNGSVRALPIAKGLAQPGCVNVILNLPAHGSCFVVFDRNAKPQENNCVSASAVKELCDLSNDWDVTSFKGVNAPTGRRKFAKLQSWSESDDAKLKYFAGRAMYEKRVTLPQGASVLDLGVVKDVVNVWAGDRFLGCLWEAPYRMTLPADLPKEFVLKLEVINTWPNRLIGDAAARASGAAEPKSKKGPWPLWVLEGKPDSGTGIYTWSNWLDGWHAGDALLPAGLIGPVRLLQE